MCTILAASTLEGFESGFEAGFESGLDGMEKFLTGIGLGVYLVMLAVCIVCLIAMARIFRKAGIAGWKVLIPFYSNYLQYKLVFGNGWLFLLTAIPVVGYIVQYVLEWNLAKAFGKGTGFAVLSLFFSPITRMIIGFGSSEYVGPQC